jgi:hypothetical protein
MANFKTLNGYKVMDGDLRVAVAPEYDPTSEYAVGAIVMHEDALYKCNTAIETGGEAWNASHWTATTVADEVEGAVDVAYNSSTQELTIS